MLRLDDVTLSVAGRPLLQGASAAIPAGHKVGIVGPNGAGKTTLFRAIRGELPLDGGDVHLPARARVGGVAQEAKASQVNLVDTVVAHDSERAALLAEETEDAARIAEIQTRLADIDAWSAEARAATILAGLGFDEAAQGRPVSDFSGGWRMRVALAGVLFAQPDVLLLDEPTNYLDLEGALWLEGYLAKYPHTVLVISHDRGLLNRAVGHILHLEDRKLTLYAGGYDTFARTRAERRAVQAAAAAKQARERAHLQSFVDRFKAKASKAKQAQSRVKMLERMEIVRAPEEEAVTRFGFPEPEQLSPPILRLEGASVGYGERVVLRSLDLRIDQDDRIALLGRNGEGKSTLSKLLADDLEVREGGRVASSKLRIGYFAQHQVDALHLEETPLDHIARLRPEEAPARLRARLASFGLGANQAETAVEKLSGGQKARLSLLLATLDAPHLLILDEPTNHLDIPSREALVEALAAYDGAVVIVSHDMHLLSLVADRLWLVKDGRVAPYGGDLEDYRGELLGLAPKAAKPEKPKAKPAKKANAAPQQPLTVKELRAEVQKCEARIAKIEGMRAQVAEKLANPDLYDDTNARDLKVWNEKYREIEAGLARAEALWEKAAEALERAEAAA
ncbi:ABC-F family ATP-binding cassette domain-containing protein [Jannaschia sp. Os4]|uniref:ABC-F family ATP-binding cassette domain-containing protein n=1 Tax=Jannaschia sp. Os4 TaxID=2807617 RepID=UPI00193A6F46|nr:ABC-F family ATP-binding cassette domain-containing protein [Jannaschia sp. Os4]MBM2577496.1 ABC-F family ATP-binding cassette domain-containing protein [Jannaschia sp. Os4]